MRNVETNLETEAQLNDRQREIAPHIEPQETEKEMAIRMFQELKRLWKLNIDAQDIPFIKNQMTPATRKRLLSYAAQLCNDLEIGSFSDWFLPAKDELNEMYANLNSLGVGGFTSAQYWSSSEYSMAEAWVQDFGSGAKYNDGKSNLGTRVRAARAF